MDDNGDDDDDDDVAGYGDKKIDFCKKTAKKKRRKNTLTLVSLVSLGWK